MIMGYHTCSTRQNYINIFLCFAFIVVIDVLILISNALDIKKRKIFMLSYCFVAVEIKFKLTYGKGRSGSKVKLTVMYWTYNLFTLFIYRTIKEEIKKLIQQ